MEKMKSLLFFSLLVSAPVFGEETYACFEKGLKDPEPIKLVISESGGSFYGVDSNWKFHADGFCDVSENQFLPETGLVTSMCFDRQERTMHQLVVMFRGLPSSEDEHWISSQQYRCIELE